jgi:hypothetical protein
MEGTEGTNGSRHSARNSDLSLQALGLTAGCMVSSWRKSVSPSKAAPASAAGGGVLLLSMYKPLCCLRQLQGAALPCLTSI